MAAAPLLKIRSVEPREGYRLVVNLDQGSTIVDFTDTIAKGGLFAELKDEKKFAQVRVGERQRVIEWPEPKDDLGYPAIEIDAESLVHMGSQQRFWHRLIDAIMPKPAKTA